MSKRNVLLVALSVLILSWAPWVPWAEVRKILEPWNALITIVATAISPLIAVQVTRVLDEQRSRNNEKMRIFRTLMEYRAARLISVEYATALSLVDVVFCGTSSQEKAIRDAFAKYMEALATPENNELNLTALHELIYQMAEYLGVNVSRQAIAKNGVYPAWVSTQLDANMKNAAAQQAMADLFKAFAQQPQGQAQPQNPAGPQIVNDVVG